MFAMYESALSARTGRSQSGRAVTSAWTDQPGGLGLFSEFVRR